MVLSREDHCATSSGFACCNGSADVSVQSPRPPRVEERWRGASRRGKRRILWLVLAAPHRRSLTSFHILCPVSDDSYCPISVHTSHWATGLHLVVCCQYTFRGEKKCITTCRASPHAVHHHLQCCITTCNASHTAMHHHLYCITTCNASQNSVSLLSSR